MSAQKRADSHQTAGITDHHTLMVSGADAVGQIAEIPFSVKTHKIPGMIPGIIAHHRTPDPQRVQCQGISVGKTVTHSCMVDQNIISRVAVLRLLINRILRQIIIDRHGLISIGHPRFHARQHLSQRLHNLLIPAAKRLPAHHLGTVEYRAVSRHRHGIIINPAAIQEIDPLCHQRRSVLNRRLLQSILSGRSSGNSGIQIHLFTFHTIFHQLRERIDIFFLLF